MKRTVVKSKDRIGEKFGKLTILKIEKSLNKKGKEAWVAECLCDCGIKTIKKSSSVIGGDTRSCGCESTTRTHGYTVKGSDKFRAKSYRTWLGMKNRCYREIDKNYKHYGARGIAVCDRWLHSFENFLEDMGEPEAGLSLDRIDNSKGYSPENCRWADWFTQAQNRRGNRVLEFNGGKQTISYWSRLYGIRHDTLIQRLDYGWPVERALTYPVRQFNSKG